MIISKDDLKKMIPNAKDEILDFLVSLTDRKIRNFCNIKEVPEELKETQIQMCIDIYDIRYNKLNKNSDTGVENETKDIKNIKRGDTQIEFSSESESLENEKNFLKELINSNNFIFNYENELYDFRKFKWDSDECECE